MHPQSSFRFAASERFQFETFETGANAELLARLQQIPERFTGTWLYGPNGRGKSHLLQAACQFAVEQQQSAVYLPLRDVADPQALSGLESLQLVALDDLDVRLGDHEFERALMALYTGLFESGSALVVATGEVPAAVQPGLADLASRLRALATFEVAALSDEDKAQVLTQRAARRGLPLSDETLSYWLRRGPRDLRRLLEDLDLLVDDALGEQSGVTIATVKRVLAL